MYTGAKTVVRTLCGNSNGFEVKISKHQLLLLQLQPFYGLWILSRTTWVSQHQKGKTRKVNIPIWIYWSKR